MKRVLAHSISLLPELLASYCLLTLASTSPIRLPQATAVFSSIAPPSVDIRQFPPATTPAPQWLQPRDGHPHGPATCGYLSGDFQLPLKCLESSTCSTDNGRINCCDEAGDCPVHYFSECIAYTAGGDVECEGMIDSFDSTACCPSHHPHCVHITVSNTLIEMPLPISHWYCDAIDMGPSALPLAPEPTMNFPADYAGEHDHAVEEDPAGINQKTLVAGIAGGMGVLFLLLFIGLIVRRSPAKKEEAAEKKKKRKERKEREKWLKEKEKKNKEKEKRRVKREKEGNKALKRGDSGKGGKVGNGKKEVGEKTTVVVEEIMSEDGTGTTSPNTAVPTRAPTMTTVPAVPAAAAREGSL